MPALITFGRILFAALFIYVGVSQLLAIDATASDITKKMAFPSLLDPYIAQLETLTSMKMPQMLAMASGAFQVVAGLMIALNFGARFFAFLLIFFIAVATFYFHNFWSQTPADPREILDTLKNLSLIGALFIIAGYGKGPSSVEPAYGDV
jgi:putative oxidoreductase